MNPNVLPMFYDYLHSPTGTLKVETNESKITSIEFLFDKTLEEVSPNHLTDEAIFQLKQYFNGHLTNFDLPLQQIGTPFQLKVWKTLPNIPFGHTWSYGQLATALGDKNKVRAVGAANGKNPFAIVVPCHRVIGQSGELVGYAGGIKRKQWLLNFERSLISGQTELF